MKPLLVVVALAAALVAAAPVAHAQSLNATGVARLNADAQAILQACNEFRIRLRRFDHSDPTLHEVFVTLVGPEAREASLR